MVSLPYAFFFREFSPSLLDRHTPVTRFGAKRFLNRHLMSRATPQWGDIFGGGLGYSSHFPTGGIPGRSSQPS
jgi:hypothetical protein